MELRRKAIIENPELLTRVLRHFGDTLNQIKRDSYRVKIMRPTAWQELLAEFPVKKWVDETLSHLGADVKDAEKGDVNVLEGLYERREQMLKEAFNLYVNALNEASGNSTLDVLKAEIRKEMGMLRKCVIPTG
jgi:uncharacterized protein (DUF1697 family)